MDRRLDELPAGMWLAIRLLDISMASDGFTPLPDSSLWTQPSPDPPRYHSSHHSVLRLVS